MADQRYTGATNTTRLIEFLKKRVGRVVRVIHTIQKTKDKTSFYFVVTNGKIIKADSFGADLFRSFLDIGSGDWGHIKKDKDSLSFHPKPIKLLNFNPFPLHESLGNYIEFFSDDYCMRFEEIEGPLQKKWKEALSALRSLNIQLRLEAIS